MEAAKQTDRYSLSSGGAADKGIVVGFDEETIILSDCLTAGIKKQLEMISIVGMPGLGKTTLARKVYNDPFIVHRFDIRAWTCISQIYNKRNILISTRLIDLKLHPRAQSNFHPRFLTQDESLVLLAIEIFLSRTIPRRLLHIAIQIAIKCQGLPLAIVVISGLLKTKAATASWWKQVAESASSYIKSGMNQYMDTLALSYNHLPQHLRPLFLFLGVFPEDYAIPVRKLIWYWVAEGLIHKVGSKSLEEIAMDSFMELLKRSLVVTIDTGFGGGIKTCRLHDLLRNLCLRKAEEDQFSPKAFATSSSPSSSSISSENEHFGPHIPHSPYGTPLKPTARPSFCSAEMGCFPQEARPILLEACKLLRVLDLESISLLLFPCEILQVVQLRYLAIRAKDGSPPTSISNLVNLQTLVISSRCNITVPKSTWKLLNLRHLCIRSGVNLVEDPCFEEVLTDDDHYYPVELENLQTLSQVCPSSHCNDILAWSANLKKIGFCGPLISEVGNLTFPNLGFSNRLEALKLLNTNSYSKTATVCNPCFFPPKLKMLTLSCTSLDWKEMWTLGMLPNLEVLKLRFHACIGDEWEAVDGGFRRLKYLKFQDLDIVQWKSSSEHFPSLQHLSVLRCPKLKKIPSELGYIPTLELIEVNNCSDSAVLSAEEIKKEQEELGNDFLKVLTIPIKDQ